MPEVSPDGKYVLYVASAGPSIPVIRVCSLAGGQPTLVEFFAFW